MWPCLSATLVATYTSSAFSAKLLKKVEILEIIRLVVLNQGFFNGAKEEAWAFVMFTTVLRRSPVLLLLLLLFHCCPVSEASLSEIYLAVFIEAPANI